MNTEILTSGLSASDCKDVFDWFQAVKARFSRFLPESELSRINGRAGDATRLSEPFAKLLFEALRYTEETGGLFLPFLGSVINHLGYNQSFEKICSSEIPVLHFLENESKQAEPVQFDLERRILKISKKELLDFGGIAKGWGVQKITLDLIRRKRISGLVDAGGDLMAWGFPEGEHWLIGLSHPRSDQVTIGKLSLSGQVGIATSSAVKRSWKSGTVRLHHIIDPRTGRPADSDCIQVTVIGKLLLPCEIYAKCLLILGSESGPEWLSARHPELAWVIINNEGKLTHSDNLGRYCDHTELPDRITLSDAERNLY